MKCHIFHGDHYVTFTHPPFSLSFLHSLFPLSLYLSSSSCSVMWYFCTFTFFRMAENVSWRVTGQQRGPFPWQRNARPVCGCGFGCRCPISLLSAAICRRDLTFIYLVSFFLTEKCLIIFSFFLFCFGCFDGERNTIIYMHPGGSRLWPRLYLVSSHRCQSFRK